MLLLIYIDENERKKYRRFLLMDAVVIKKPGCVTLEQMDIPDPPAGFVRVKVKAAAICATDLEVLDGNIPANYPLVPGHFPAVAYPAPAAVSAFPDSHPDC